MNDFEHYEHEDCRHLVMQFRIDVDRMHRLAKNESITIVNNIKKWQKRKIDHLVQELKSPN